MTIYYICRHGKSEYNQQKRLQGHIDTPLTLEGIENAHSISNKIKNIHFDFIFSSDLGRAFMTTYIITHDIGFQNEIITFKQLREVNFGDLAGTLVQEAEIKYPSLQGDINFVPPNGESLGQLQERVFEFIIELSDKYPNNTILLVTHDVVINSIYSMYKQINFGPYNKEHYNAHDFVGKFVFDKGIVKSFDEIIC